MVALGATVQVSLPPPKRFDRHRLIVPATAVRDILGKQAARAAPMLALAARSRLYASAMSARRNNIVDDRRSVVSGKSVSVRVDRGGSLLINTHNTSFAFYLVRYLIQ